MHDQHPDQARPSHPHPADTNGLGTTRIDHAPTDDTFEFDPSALRMVMVVWKDAESQGGPTWEDTDEMLDFARRPLSPVTTVGLLLHLDDEQIAITDTVAMDQTGGVTKIPRAWVERFEVLTPTAALPVLPKHRDVQNPTRRVG